MNERIAILETEVRHLQDTSNEMNKKLDDLLQLRSKGVGAFWLASALTGTGIITVFLKVLGWLKGVEV